jgi:hypothetical protein
LGRKLRQIIADLFLFELDANNKWHWAGTGFGTWYPNLYYSGFDPETSANTPNPQR